MKIAIPKFGERVSPRFDCAQVFLLFEIHDGESPKRREIEATGWAPHERIHRLVELGVDAVVCGGIDCWSVESLHAAGVTVYGWVVGEVDDALARLLAGNLEPDAVMRAASGGRCRQFRGGNDSAGQPAGPGRRGKCRGRRAGNRGQSE